MVSLRRAHETIQDATDAVRDNSEILMMVAGVAIIFAAVALYVAVSVKASK